MMFVDAEMGNTFHNKKLKYSNNTQSLVLKTINRKSDEEVVSILKYQNYSMWENPKVLDSVVWYRILKIIQIQHIYHT